MIAYECIEKTQEYLDYVKRHIQNVEKAWLEIQEQCRNMKFVYDDFVNLCIDGEVKAHDLSKLTEHEFVQYRRNFFTTSYETGQWIYLEFEKAWEHHKKENSHHWQVWTKKKYSNPYGWMIDCVHMIVDWVAMSYEFGDTARDFYEKENNKEMRNALREYDDFIQEIFDNLYGNESNQ